jgi:hypothetical protein
VRTQLSLALVALVAHMGAEHWQGVSAVQFLAARYTTEPQGVALPCLLELLLLLPQVPPDPRTPMKKLRIVTYVRVGTGRQRMVLERWKNPTLSRRTCTYVSTGYNLDEGNRRASRNGLVSHLPPEIPTVTIRNFCAARLCAFAREITANLTPHCCGGGATQESHGYPSMRPGTRRAFVVGLLRATGDALQLLASCLSTPHTPRMRNQIVEAFGAWVRLSAGGAGEKEDGVRTLPAADLIAAHPLTVRAVVRRGRQRSAQSERAQRCCAS